MFTSVKNLTRLIDNTIEYYIDGMNSKENHSHHEFEQWHENILKALSGQLEKLKQISINTNLLLKYENRINSLFEQYE